jgi:alpha-galactosidase
MGWNNYNYYGDNFDATLLERTGDAFVAKGLRDAGYVYVNMDDSWDLTARDASGQLVPDPAKFPDGIKPVADYLHARGLKLGIYADRGLLTCGGATHGAQHWPGSYKHEAEDAALFASWGVDLVKVDNCNLAPGQQNTMEQDYTTWANAIRATGRPMLLSICAWHFYDWMPKVGQMYRTTLDIKGNWPSFLSHLDQNGGFTPRYADALYPAPGIGPTAGPGHWNDPDMLEVGNPGMTADEQRAQFSLWAIMASPLILGNDVIDMDAATQALLTNHEVLAVDQDPLGKQGGPISASTTLEVWAKPLSGPASYAVVLFNRTGGAADITVTWASLGLTGPATVRDLWAGSDLGTQATGYTAQVPSHGAVMLKVVGGG